MTDRITEPGLKEIGQLEALCPEEKKLDNGLPVFLINAGTQDVVQIELMFKSGSWYQEKALQAAATNTMLSEGTSTHTALQIAGQFDYYGAFLQSGCGNDIATVTLYSLNKHLEAVLPLLASVIKDAVFPEQEFKIHIGKTRQKFIISNEKVNVVALKQFNEAIFGNAYPYGRKVELPHFEKLQRADLPEFFNQHYSAKNCRLIVSGKIHDDIFELINTHFGGSDWANSVSLNQSAYPINTSEAHTHFFSKKNAVQSAIQIGRVLFSKTHQDYMGMYVLSTILGGYFGSRLMSNIREDKGYTYGIGSGVVSHQNSGYFFIATETGAEVTGKAIDEIYFELKRMRDETVPVEELQLVKNYLLGRFMRSFDGPFALADRLKGVLYYDVGYEYYERFVNTIKEITPGQLQDLANSYLAQDELTEVVVGKKHT